MNPSDIAWSAAVLCCGVAGGVMAALVHIQTRWGRPPRLGACMLGGLHILRAHLRGQSLRAVKFAPLLALSVLAYEVLHYVS